MALNVNTVYTTVLSILNKEQRGYLTPDEFNKIATQVQLEIFESYFEDYNQYLRMPKTDVEFASRLDHIRDELQPFIINAFASAVNGNVYTLPTATEVYRLGAAFYERVTGAPEIQIVSKRDYHEQIQSPILKPSKNFPIATYSDNKLTVFPTVTTTPNVNDIGFNYIKKPTDPVWGFTVNSVGAYIYNAGTSTNFEIEDSNQTDVILNILKYAGVVIRDPQIVQAASQELAQNEANTKR